MGVSSTDQYSHLIDNECTLLSGIMAEERPITVDEACSLKLLLFGSLEKCFSSAWTKQSFKFRRVPPYGFIQKKPGPCGVLAAVQASVLYELIYGVSRIAIDSEITKITPYKKHEALARALTAILWQAGGNKIAIVAKKGNTIVLNTPAGSDILEPDGILESLKFIYFECKACLLEYYTNFITEMTTDNYPSCIYFLISVIMTHGFEKFQEEMDCKDNYLIGDDGYCSQEIVNLMLTGNAVQNLFDGVVELNSGGSETTRLRGISRRSKIGLFSLFEYQGITTVGDNYKNPVFPIWVMIADNHFTVLYALSRRILRNENSEDPFVLYHYNGLARRFAENSYHINPAGHPSPRPIDRTLPSVICCIYTRWPNASVDELQSETSSSTIEEDTSE